MAYNVVKGDVENKIKGSVTEDGDQTIRGNKTFSQPLTSSAFYDSTIGKPLAYPALTFINNDTSGAIVVSNGDGTAGSYGGLTFNGDCLQATAYFGSAVGLTNLQATEIVGKIPLENLSYGGALMSNNQKLEIKAGRGININDSGVHFYNAANGGIENGDAGVRIDPMLATLKRSVGTNDRFLIADSSQGNELKSVTIKSLSSYIQNTIKLTRPHGNTGQIQLNNRGLFGSSANLVFDTDTLTTINIDCHNQLKVGDNLIKKDKAILSAPNKPVDSGKLPPGTFSFYLDEAKEVLMIKIKYSTGIVKTFGLDLLADRDIDDDEKIEGFLLDEDTIDDELEIDEEEIPLETFEQHEISGSSNETSSSGGILGYFKSAFTKK